MATVKIDRDTVLEAQERDGALKRLVRECVVIGLAGVTDWEILTDALDLAGVPSYNEALTESTSNNAYDMRVVERNVSVLNNDKGTVKIVLVYESTFDREQDLNNPRGGIALAETRNAIQQKSTNFDGEGDQVSVQHQYPADDANHPGELITQGGEFQYFEAQTVMFLRGIKTTKQPWLITTSIIGRVNSVAFQGQDKRTWLCTSATYRPGWSGASSRLSVNNRWYMEFEWEFNPFTWDSDVVFTDDVTGKAPVDLIVDTGYKTVEKLNEGDFEDIIGVAILGG